LISIFRGELVAKLRPGGAVIAAIRPGAAALAEHPVETVDQQVEGFVGVVAIQGGDEIGAANLDATLGDEAGLIVLGLVMFEVDADAHEMVFVAQEARTFFKDSGAKRWGEREVNAADEDFFSEHGGRVAREESGFVFEFHARGLTHHPRARSVEKMAAIQAAAYARRERPG
jgi:hypothetical protein